MYPFQRHAPSEDGPSRPIRLHFPVMEHPDQRPEQAPLRMREMLYEAADAEAAVRDEYMYREPLNIFWDEGLYNNDNDNSDNRSTTGAVITRNPPIYLEDDEEDNVQVMRRRRRPRIRGVNTSGLNFILAMVFMIMFIAVAITIGELCRSGQCGSSGSSGDDASSPSSDILSMTQAPSVSPTIAPSLKPSVQGSYNILNNQTGDDNNNIFLRPTPVPTTVPLNDNTPDDWTNDFYSNQSATTNTNANANGTGLISDDNNSWYSGTLEPTRTNEAVVIVEEENSINGTDLIIIPTNNTTDDSNSTAATSPGEGIGSTNSTASLEDSNVTITVPLLGNDNDTESETTPVPILTTTRQTPPPP